jgi:hypothetical protein
LPCGPAVLDAGRTATREQQSNTMLCMKSGWSANTVAKSSSRTLTAKRRYDWSPHPLVDAAKVPREFLNGCMFVDGVQQPAYCAIRSVRVEHDAACLTGDTPALSNCTRARSYCTYTCYTSLLLQKDH